MIKIKNIRKYYGEKLALNDINLDIKKGEIFALLGPNGAGKTTTIKIMTGLLQPDNGSCYLDNKNIVTQPEAAKSIIGYIPDTPYLYNKLTILEFLDFIVELYDVSNIDSGYSASENSGKTYFPSNTDIDHYIDFFELGPYKNTLIEELSHGTKQKVLYVAAFIHNPKILILDEPMVGLDPYTIRNIKDLLIQKSREEGLTIFMSTHIISIAEEIADRIGVINKGNIMQCDNVNTIINNQSLESFFLKLTRT